NSLLSYENLRCRSSWNDFFTKKSSLQRSVRRGTTAGTIFQKAARRYNYSAVPHGTTDRNDASSVHRFRRIVPRSFPRGAAGTILSQPLLPQREFGFSPLYRQCRQKRAGPKEKSERKRARPKTPFFPPRLLSPSRSCRSAADKLRGLFKPLVL